MSILTVGVFQAIQRFVLLMFAMSVSMGVAWSYSLSAFSDPQAQCHDRETGSYLSVVDSHVHFLPFGGPGIPFGEMVDYLDKAGVRFVNVYGIGQTLPRDSACIYYLNCPGVPVLPNPGNDIQNARAFLVSKPNNLHVALSMSFPDLEHPDAILETVDQMDREFPGVFTWAGEVNLVKQALFNNHHNVPDINTLRRAFHEATERPGHPIDHSCRSWQHGRAYPLSQAD